MTKLEWNLRDLASEARLAYMARVEDAMYGRPKDPAKARRLNKALDAVANELDMDREQAAKYLWGSDWKWI